MAARRAGNFAQSKYRFNALAADDVEEGERWAFG